MTKTPFTLQACFVLPTKLYALQWHLLAYCMVLLSLTGLRPCLLVWQPTPRRALRIFHSDKKFITSLSSLKVIKDAAHRSTCVGLNRQTTASYLLFAKMAFSRHYRQYLYVSLAEHQIYSILMGLQEYHPQLRQVLVNPSTPGGSDGTNIVSPSRVCRKL